MNTKISPECLKQFITATENLASFSPALLPLISIDTTAVKPLLQIQDQSQSGHSQQAVLLYQSSSSTLSLLETIDDMYRTLFHCPSFPSQSNNQIKTKRKPQEKKQNILKSFFQSYELKQQFFQKVENDENVDKSNFESKGKEKQLNNQVELKQIIRPEYRKTTNCNNLTRRERKKMDHDKIQSCREQNSEIPLIANRKNKPIQGNTVKNGQKLVCKRSVSPKMESRVNPQTNQHPLINISTISKQVQTQSCFSLDIDLSLPQAFNQSSNSITAKSDPLAGLDSKPRISNSNPKKQSESSYIQEQQPWECDEDELEEELRQINERLSHRNHHHQNQKEEIQGQRNNHLKTNQRLGKKEPKTVRLSLTPSKRKSLLSPYSSRQKIEIVNVIRTPDKSFENVKEKSEIKCQKWKKPKSGNLTINLQRYL